MKATAAKLVRPRGFEIRDVEIPPLKKNEVLIEVASCGICVSEVPVFLGSVVGTPGVSFRYKQYPADLGHEVIGQVADKGSEVARFQVGDWVTGLTYSGCGFATHFVEDQASLIRIPSGPEEAMKVAIGEPLMATANIVRQLQINFGDSVLVVGDGFMALLLIAALGRYPLQHLIVVGHHASRLALARECGATVLINSKEEDAWKRIMDLTGNLGVDISVEYAGTPDSLRLAASVCKAKVRAKLALAAAYENEMPLTIGNYLQNRAPVIVPAYPNQSFNKAEDMERGLWGLLQGVFPMDKLVTHRYPLDKVGQGYEDCIARRDGYVKGIVVPKG